METTSTAAQDPSAMSDEEGVDVEELKAEVAKWQERVPKLASALRERTDELADARDQLRALKAEHSQQQSDDRDAGLRARDSLIEELEAKLRDSNEKREKLAGDLHTAELARSNAFDDAQSWKDKWSELSAALDAEASKLRDAEQQFSQARARWQGEIREREASLAELEARQAEEQESLRKRNEQLAESMTLANKQIETLGDELSQLIQRLKAEQEQAKAVAESLAAAEKTAAASEKSLGETQSKLNETEQELHVTQKQAAACEDDLLVQVDDLQQKLDAIAQEQAQDQAEWEDKTKLLQNELAAKSSEAIKLEAEVERVSEHMTKLRGDTSARQEQLENEVERLERCLVDAQTGLSRVEQERIVCNEKADEYQAEIARLQQKLDERADLVNSLEQSRAELESRQVEVAAKESQGKEEKERLQIALNSAEKKLATYIEHNETLETRISEQRSLLEQMDGELRSEQEKIRRQKRSLESQEKIRHEMEDQAQNSNEQIARLQIEKDSLQQASDKLSSELADLQVRFDAAQAEHDTAAKALEQVDEHAQALKLAQTEKEELLAHHRTLQVAKDLAEQAKEEAEARCQALQEANQQAQVEMQALHESQASDLQQSAGVAELQDEVAGLTAELEAAEDTLQIKNTKLKQVQAELLVVKAESVDGSGLQAMQVHIKELERKLRDRTQQLDEMRWREAQDQAIPENSDAMVMVLNQQLKDARDEIERLKKIAKSEPGKLDDLTVLRGVGERIVEQLEEAGITSLQQVAELEESELADENHPLAHLKARILRDEWISQAKKLCH